MEVLFPLCQPGCVYYLSSICLQKVQCFPNTLLGFVFVCYCPSGFHYSASVRITSARLVLRFQLSNTKQSSLIQQI